MEQCIEESCHVVYLVGRQLKYGQHDQQKSDSSPTNYWGKGLKIVHTSQLLDTTGIEVCLELLNSPSGYCLHLNAQVEGNTIMFGSQRTTSHVSFW